jgi:hypothetical protein
MPMFRKKPVVIEARQFDGTNSFELSKWIGETCNYAGPCGVSIKTLEGIVHASVYDWIIKGVKGEFYPCKPDIFDATYEIAK